MFKLLLVTVLVTACVHAKLLKGVIDEKPVFNMKNLEDEANENDLSYPPDMAIPGIYDIQCSEIGEFCNYHTDCCSNACLGYMKRCVSGSG
ncbi:unnamed protein product [Pieris brassicae]|uniref:WAP domain-containing protein n=1 Tax=Pieris brassicae TaxID=7116 RepID=A0A9P0SRB6_PIEBR|nr:unnamed protein product [Pieris brassicae]